MQIESILTCPRCGFQSAEQMPTDACQFFMSAKAADRSSSHWLAIAACSVRSGRCPARRSSEAGKARVARDDGSEHIFRYLNLGKNA
jgi:hypothetical protein